IRMHQPISVNQTEVYSFPTWFEGVDDEINESRLLQLQWRHSQAGLIGPDDVEMFTGAQSGMAAAEVGWINLTRGLNTEVEQADGVRVGESSSETPLRAIHRGWSSLMNEALATDGDEV
ncbi:MAG: (2Fe-2S)-binding protein, partial [Phycisphaerales bacterium]